VAFGGRVQPVDGLGGGADGRVEAERALGSAHVVVYRLGNTDHRQTLLPELVGDLQAPIPSDGHQRIETAGLKSRNQVVGAVDLVLLAVGVSLNVPKGITAVGSAENGAAQMGDAADLGQPERNHSIEADQTLVSALNAI
jgi:hypothetical protein